MIDQGIYWYERRKWSDLDIADDITALSESPEGLPGLVSAISKVAGCLILLINDKKTKIMLSGNHQSLNDIIIGQNKMEVIEDFNYLRSSINNQGTKDHGISCKIWKVCAAFNQLIKI